MTQQELEKHEGPVWVLERPLELPQRWDSWEFPDNWDGMVFSPGERYPFSLLAVFPDETSALRHRLDAVSKAMKDYHRLYMDILRRLVQIGVITGQSVEV
jgi:hypothetical protein